MITETFRITNISKTLRNTFFDIHQHTTYEVVCIQKGSLQLQIDFQTYCLKENTVYLIQPGQIHQWLEKNFLKDCRGFIFHFSKDFLPSLSMVHQLFENTTLPIIELNCQTMQIITQLSKLIDTAMNQRIKVHLFASILEYILEFKQTTHNLYYKDKRIYELIDLIEDNFKQKKTAQFYAEHFKLTTKRLNELTKEYLNMTLSSLIIDRTIVEIKRELTFTDKTMSKISQELGFNDAAQFSKFFKKYTQHTPLSFKQLQQKI